MAKLFRNSTQIAAIELTREAIGKRLHIATSRSIGLPSSAEPVIVVGVVREIYLGDLAVGIGFVGIQPAPAALPELMPGFFFVQPGDLVELDLSTDDA